MIQFNAKFKIFLSLLLLLLTVTLAQLDNATDFERTSCSVDYIMNGSVLERNLNVGLNSLVKNVDEIGYNLSWYGENGDKIYGLSQCRGDLNASACRACASYAKTDLVEDCRGSSSGSIHLQGCFLRYATHNFYSKLDTSSYVGCQNYTSITDANSRVLDWSIASLLTRLLENTLSSNVGYSTLSGDGVYTLAQCWRDLSMDQCSRCLNDVYRLLASCWRGSKEGQVMLENCMIRYATHQFYGNPVLLPSTATRSRATEGKGHPKLLGVIAGVVIVVLLLGLVVVWKRKGINPLCQKSLYQKPLSGYCKPSTELSTAISKSKLNYKFRTLQIATKSFNPTNKIGQGGFGSVYKGVLPDGREIAVKRLFVNREQCVNDFFNEVDLISRVQHRNLIKLLGCSVDGPDKLLVYEYLPNKSLDHFLFDENLDKLLDWHRRFEIILGTASGLAYLHQESDIRIIHRDIKPSNILLDQHFRPKIADFGLVRYFAEDQTHLSTAIVGTRGYMAPEYLVHGHLTEKVDVYAFGVLVLQIISGRKIKTPMYANGMPSLLTVVWSNYLSDTLSNIIDLNIREICLKEVLQGVHIALLCTQTSATLRPSMSEVIIYLMNKGLNLPAATQPPYIDISSSQSNTNGAVASSDSQSKTNTSAASEWKTYDPLSNIIASSTGTLTSLNTVSTNSFGPR